MKKLNTVWELPGYRLKFALRIDGSRRAFTFVSRESFSSIIYAKKRAYFRNALYSKDIKERILYRSINFLRLCGNISTISSRPPAIPLQIFTN